MPAQTPNYPFAAAILPLLHTDAFAALEDIHRDAAPLEIAACYHALLRHAYWKLHDLPAVVAIARAGITWCLARSLEPGTPADLVEALRSAAKHLAYDAGSFTWPGWEEPGIVPMPADLAFGRQCAALNLRLAIELKRPAEGLSRAYWLIGAHALSAGDPAAAVENFQQSQAALPPDDPAARSMQPFHRGYVALAQLVQNPSDPAARDAFQGAIAELAGRTDKDAAPSKAQLLTAHHHFLPTNAAEAN